jgi:hypothetical protein
LLGIATENCFGYIPGCVLSHPQYQDHSVHQLHPCKSGERPEREEEGGGPEEREESRPGPLEEPSAGQDGEEDDEGAGLFASMGLRAGAEGAGAA